MHGVRTQIAFLWMLADLHQMSRRDQRRNTEWKEPPKEKWLCFPRDNTHDIIVAMRSIAVFILSLAFVLPVEVPRFSIVRVYSGKVHGESL